MQVQKRAIGLWAWLTLEGQHVIFRLVSLIFSAASALSIYWFFSALWTDLVGRVVTLAMTVGFVVLGYFLTRGIAYRLKNKQPIHSYSFVLLLYLVVEMSCNLAHGAVQYADVTWIHQLSGWQLGFFSQITEVIFSILPLFNIAMAWLDVDLMQEKGHLPAMGLPKGQPKQSSTIPPRPAPSNGAGPQASYPTSSQSGQQGGTTGLPNYYAARGSGNQVPSQGRPQQGQTSYQQMPPLVAQQQAAGGSNGYQP